MKRLLTLMILGIAGPVSGLALQTAPDQGPPPTSLQQRDGHWTVNQTPAENTSEFQTHIVVAGDTLWAIADAYMNDPFLWPQVWESNAHIVNPHWIYPDDLVLLRPITGISEVAPPPPVPEVATQTPRIIQIPVLTPREAYVLAPDPVTFNSTDRRAASPVKPVDLYCSGFIATRTIDSETSTVAALMPPAEGLWSYEGRYVYVSRGSTGGVVAGDILSVIRPTRNIQSPRDDVGRLGRHYLELGQMEAVIVQPAFSLARVIHSCAEITIGDIVVDFEEIDFPELPSDRPFSPFMPASGKTSGVIAMTLNPLHTAPTPSLGGSGVIAGYRRGLREEGSLEGVIGGLVGTGHIVYLDLGEREGVHTGDLFVIYRRVDIRGNGLLTISKETAQLLAGERYAIGELVVLKVEERASTALITYSSDGISPGDLVELR